MKNYIFSHEDSFLFIYLCVSACVCVRVHTVSGKNYDNINDNLIFLRFNFLDIGWLYIVIIIINNKSIVFFSFCCYCCCCCNQ